MTDLHRLAEMLGVRVVRHAGGSPAFYRHSLRTISTRRGQSVESYRSTFAHELGHAFYEDVSCMARAPARHEYQERRADRFAALLLIDPDEFRDAAVWHEDHLGAIADELEVTHHIAATYAGTLERNHHS